MFSQPMKPYSHEELKEQLECYKLLIDYLDDPVFLTHRIWDGEDFLQTVVSAINKTVIYMENRGLNSGYKGKPNPVISDIIDTYKIYPDVILLGLIGKRSAAFTLLKEKILPKLNTPFSIFRDLPGDIRFDRDNIIYGYRIRIGNNSYNSNYERRDLFHIPFELNHLIGNNRFSLSGFPCLYLSSSSYGAWEELNRPDINHCFVSKFDLTQLSFIDLSITPSEMSQLLKNHILHLEKYDGEVSAELVENFEFFLILYLYLWPAILCCSFKVRNNSVFKPEYIFPQLLLEWLVSEEPSWYDGIKFFSTKSLALDGYVDIDIKKLAKNYVIPARKYKNNGFCTEYVDKIALTKPINYGFQSLFGSRFISTDADQASYESTIFGIIEKILSNEPLEKLKQ